jgi:pilus assembly protein CpaE
MHRRRVDSDRKRTSARRRRAIRCECGQASLEFLGSLPVALLAVAVAWQLVLAGHTVWMAGNAARVAARAGAVGRDPRVAARSALPSYLEEGLSVQRRGPRVTVRVALPILSGRWHTPARITGSASMERQ